MMELRKLGKSDLKFPPITFGAWAIGGWFWGKSDDHLAIEAIQKGIDLGITAIDTAPMYGYGYSEQIVGQAIKGYRDRVFIATKCGLRWDSTDGVYFFDSEKDGSKKIYRNLKRQSIINECEQSLKRLGVDVIDLYQCHWPDPSTPLMETMEAMLYLQKQGKIKAIGVSNFTVEMIKEASAYATITSDQAKYNLLERQIEKELMPYCTENQIGILAYSPLEQGLLTGKVTVDRQFLPGDWRTGLPWFRPENRRKVLDGLSKLQPIAKAHQVSPCQIALNWILNAPGVTSAIVGIRNVEQLLENAKAVSFQLTVQERTYVKSIFESISGPLPISV